MLSVYKFGIQNNNFFLKYSSCTMRIYIRAKKLKIIL